MEIDQYYDTKNKDQRVEKKDIVIEKKGIFISKHQWQGSMDSSIKILNTLVKDKMDWTKVKTLYRYPNLSLSRDKVSLLKDKYGTKITRDRDNADVHVISNKTIEKLISSDMYYGNLWTIKTFKDVKLPELKKVMTEEAYEHVEGTLSHLHEDSYIFGGDRYNSWNNSDAFDKCPLTYFTNGDWRNHSDGQGAMYIKAKDIEEWESFDDSTKNFVSDIYVNEVCSEDSITLDWDYYKNIKKMMSATNEDKDVAMSLMSNCRIEESKTALGLLFYHYGDSMKGTKIWNQVAFKTIRKQFDHYMVGGWNTSHTSTFSQLIQKLAEDNALTEDAMKHVCELVFERVLMSGCGFSQDDCAFEMDLSDVRLTKEYKNKLKKEDKTLSELVTEGHNILPF